MLLIPAIDLANGKCVRLRQGKMDEKTIYSEDPIATAEHWVKEGAQRLHIIDLEGARDGKPVHISIIGEIARRFPDIAIQVGGGIRNEDTVQAYLDQGVQYLVLSTRAVAQPHFVNDLCMEFPNHIIVGLDVRHGKVSVSGWSKLTRHDIIDLAQHFESDGVAAIIHTDIERDGMLSGLNVEASQELAASIHIPVIAAGGINTLADIEALCQVKDEGVIGAVVGRALYEKTLDYKEALQLIEKLKAQK